MFFSQSVRAVAHVGLPKAASTYLQKHYFPHIAKYFFSTQPPFDWPQELEFILSGNSLWYKDLCQGERIVARQERAARYAKHVRPRMRSWRAAAREFAQQAQMYDSWLLSAEGLCGLSAEVNAMHMALLKNAGVDKIIFVCRQQADWAQSLWRQFLLAEDRFSRFISFEILFGKEGGDSWVIDLDWNHYVSAMDAEFGRENVLVLPYELLASKPVDFFGRINHFLGLPHDVFVPDIATHENLSRRDSFYRSLAVDNVFPFNQMPRLRSRLHRLLHRFPRLVPAGMWSDKPMAVPEADLAALMSRLKPANEQLASRVGMDMSAYGYY